MNVPNEERAQCDANYPIRPVIPTCIAKLIPTGSVHYALEWSSRLFGMTFRMILRSVKPCALIKGIGWRKYNVYLIWKYIICGCHRCRHHYSPHPATAVNIAMSQVDFPTQIVMWPHRLVSTGYLHPRYTHSRAAFSVHIGSPSQSGYTTSRDTQPLQAASCDCSNPVHFCSLRITRVPKAAFKPSPICHKLGLWGDSAPYRHIYDWT